MLRKLLRKNILKNILHIESKSMLANILYRREYARKHSENIQYKHAQENIGENMLKDILQRQQLAQEHSV